MQKAIRRVMACYALMVTLWPEEERDARERLERHLAGITGDDEALAIEGLKFLREPRQVRRRRSSEEIVSANASTPRQ